MLSLIVMLGEFPFLKIRVEFPMTSLQTNKNSALLNETKLLPGQVIHYRVSTNYASFFETFEMDNLKITAFRDFSL